MDSLHASKSAGDFIMLMLCLSFFIFWGIWMNNLLITWPYQSELQCRNSSSGKNRRKVQKRSPSSPSGFLGLLELHGLQQTLEAEVVRVEVNGGLVGRRALCFWLERRERVGSASPHVHLQLLEDLQGVGHLCLTAGERRLTVSS